MSFARKRLTIPPSAKTALSAYPTLLYILLSPIPDFVSSSALAPSDLIVFVSSLRTALPSLTSHLLSTPEFVSLDASGL